MVCPDIIHPPVRWCAAVFLTLVLSLPASARSIIIDQPFENTAIGPHMDYLVDDGGGLTMRDIIERKYDARWIPCSMESPGFGYTRSVYWVRFTVENKTGKEAEFYIEAAYPLLENITLYCPGEPGFRPIEVGFKKPFHARVYDHRTFIFPLTIRLKSVKTYYMRFDSESAKNLYLHLWSPAAFQKNLRTESIINWMFYGVMLIMAVYNLFIFLSIRERSYLFYIVYIVGFGLFLMSMDGIAYQFLWPDSVWWARMSIPVLVGLVNFSVVLFALYYINPWRFPESRLRNAMIGMLRVMAVLSILHSCASIVLDNFFISVVSSATLTSLNAVLGGILLAVSIILYKSREAWFFLAGFIFFIVGALMFALKEFSILPAIFITRHGVQLGAAINVVLLSFALGDRINISRKDLQELNANLENKVKERTDELQAAMEELEVTNDQLIKTRDSLWSEIEIAKKIQTVLLPRKPEMPGYEISAHMNPSAMVGGDYYDIINAGGSEWLVIGDVSGHGVPAGLIMMMTQTLINFVVTENPGLPPSRILGLINGTLTRNIRLMGEDKYMTITLLASIMDGKFRFSGLHQDIMIYRAGTGTIDLVETRGGWLGLEEFHAGDFADDSLYLDIGDVMLLYTDGITEAWRKDSVKDKRRPEDDMFGDRRLMDIFSKAGREKPERIKLAILKGLEDYTCQDDVTLIVVKRTR